MAAERRCAAALDRRHDLQLVQADVSGIGSTPRRSVVAEDIRDLQLRTEHCRGRLGWRLIGLAVRWLSFWLGLSGLLARLAQQIEWARDVGDHAGGDPGIARRRL